MRKKWISILLAVALGALMLTVTGCGGGGSSTTNAAITTETEATDHPATDTEATDTEATDTEATDTEETETEATGTPDLSFATSENCQEFIALASSFAAAIGGTAGTETEKAAQALEDFADQAPEEIRDDFQTLADAYAKIAEALQGVDLSSGQAPSADVLAKLQQLSSEIDTVKVSDASANIAAWTQENCTNG